ncbi:DUF2332 family protein, partial [Salmonella enterica]|uniref:DUF2332 family protein n=1 Tax=Salmonella enterica TaxID=28901 RepID=UPI003CF9BA94
EPADAADWVEAVLVAAPPPGIVRVLFHSIAYQYFPEATKTRIATHLERLGRAAGPDAPLAWLAFEQFDDQGPRLTLRLWPDGTERLL